jgi:hypothetical protein
MVNAVKATGEPIEPPKVRAKFWNAIGSIIRTKMVLDPTIPDWLMVSMGKKEAMWALLRKTFIFPRGTQEKVKYYAKKMLGETFHWWKSDLNTKKVQKGREPFVDWGNHTGTMGGVCSAKDL